MNMKIKEELLRLPNVEIELKKIAYNFTNLFIYFHIFRLRNKKNSMSDKILIL